MSFRKLVSLFIVVLSGHGLAPCHAQTHGTLHNIPPGGINGSSLAVPDSSSDEFVRYQAELLRDLDWISYFSNARHILIPGSEIESKQTNGTRYLQDIRYDGAAALLHRTPIRYIARFYLRRLPANESVTRPHDTLCVIKVKIHFRGCETMRDTTFSSIVRRGDLSEHESVPVYLVYSPGSIIGDEGSGAALKIETEFSVEATSVEDRFTVEKIEVTDTAIWEKYFNMPGNEEVTARLREYLLARAKSEGVPVGSDGNSLSGGSASTSATSTRIVEK